jgi:hypothetical protein
VQPDLSDPTTYLMHTLAAQCRDALIQQSGMSWVNPTENQILHKMFYNFRQHDNIYRGIRLTRPGLDAMSAYYCEYQHTITCNSVNLKIMIGLDRHMQWPYYLSSKRLVLFNEMDNAIFQLSGSNLQYFADNCN